MKKFFSRLTGTNTDYDEYETDAHSTNNVHFQSEDEGRAARINTREEQWAAEEPTGELAVDVYQTPDAIVVKALVAGVQPAEQNGKGAPYVVNGTRADASGILARTAPTVHRLTDRSH